ncbi:MAG: hypothetical protein HY735_16170 [Verrucomicrobia bacterium]|nr:hypothetical protein [Verrucomicrobiota bacterium]
MPSVFHHQAYRAVGGTAASDTAFLDWRSLGKALDRLSPEQRCDAIYADWLLQLTSPSHQALLQIRNLLIRQGAIAANYLAELAQNAHDASDGLQARIRIVLDGDWLFVGNNGRKVTSLNLLGLCRFFVHAADKRIVELSEETIGRFGIGFKSCYRIASEVFVFTWDREGSFAFRLPICREADADSAPDRERLEHVISHLEAAGVRQLDSGLRDIGSLGYCTPEFHPELPRRLAQRTDHLCQTERGTLFCFHLRPDRCSEVEARVTGQERELYELCPLFLPNLRLIQLAHQELEMAVSDNDTADNVSGSVVADRITLATRTINQPQVRQSKSRFWRLRGVTPGDQWQVALHADSSFRLRVEREDDEHGTTIKDGSAYAFFPLNAVSWPFRLHLHLKLPTNLARSDWNPDDASRVEEQIRRAVSGTTAWLENNPDKWHSNWRLEHLVVREPNQSERWARLVWENLVANANSRALVRTVWGTRCTARQGRAVRLIDWDGARRNWLEFCGGLHDLESEFPIVDATAPVDFGLEALTDRDLGAFFLRAIDCVPAGAAQLRLITALFTVETAGPDTLESVAERILIPCLDGTEQTLATLMQQPAGSWFPEVWHEAFRKLENWLWGIPHGLTSVFSGQLRFQLQKLAKEVFNPRWAAVPTVLASEEAWQQHGTEFWQLEREPCPQGIRRTVLECLRVRDGANSWKPITSVWLVDNSPVQCFHGVVGKWERGSAPNHDAQRVVGQRLEKWGLWESYCQGVESLLRQNLHQVLFSKLQAGDACPFDSVFDIAHNNSKSSLEHRWRSLVDKAESDAARQFVRSHRRELGEGRLVDLDLGALHDVFTWTGRFTPAPIWLTSTALRQLRLLGDDAPLVELLTQDHLTTRARELAELLLGQFHRWRQRTVSDTEASAIEDLLKQTPTTLRGNWRIGMTNQTSVLLKDLLNPTVTPLLLSGTGDAAANLPLLNHPERRWLRAQELPEILRRIAAIAEACLQISDLEIDVITEGLCLPITLEQVEAATREDSVFRGMLRACGEALMGCLGRIDVLWHRGSEVVAELRRAPFAVKEGKVITTKTTAHIEDRQFNEVLALYSRKVRDNEEFRRRWHEPNPDHARLYSDFRKEILQTLLQTEVTDLGYREHHVIRELLQNAESAYDTKPGELASQCEFEFVLRPPTMDAAWEGVVTHSGRHFNEQVKKSDSTLQDRDDIRLIVSTPSGETPLSEGWIGRFNRGFKSIFTVAETVHVESGPYRFAIQDMLLLNPVNPQRDATWFSPLTKFAFRCSKTAAMRLLRLPSLDGQHRPLPIFSPASFVFLQRVNRIRVQADRFEWRWAITREQAADGWTVTEVAQSVPSVCERFLVFRGEVLGSRQSGPARRFSVALRLAGRLQSDLPTELDPTWRWIRLTFETEDDFPLDFLANGDFETDSARQGIRNSAANETLLAACLRSVGDLCRKRLTGGCEISHWLAWADVLHLRDGEAQLSQRFEAHHDSLVKEYKGIAEFLCDHVPCGIRTCAAADFTFPTALVRRLAAFVHRWGYSTEDWIDTRVEERLPRSLRDAQEKVSLDSIVGSLGAGAPVLRTVQSDFESAAFRANLGSMDAIASGEMERAKRILEEKLCPRLPPRDEEAVEPWTVANLWHWWEKRKDAVPDYTLDGANWTLLYPGDQTAPGQRTARLRHELSHPDTDSGRRVWYRMLGLACLMSARGRMETLRRFWAENLEGSGFWTVTSEECDFAERTSDLFSKLVLRTHRDAGATGEWAEYWRRVFYDVRKVHELVWEHEFADTVLRLAADKARSRDLPGFLRSGQIVGQQAWAGVLGQSAGAPLFFVVRELCRLEIISPDLKPLSFFACTPVRQAAASIVWIDPQLAARTDFRSLAEISERLYEKLRGDAQFGRHLLPFYDIPLLHMGLSD